LTIFITDGAFYIFCGRPVKPSSLNLRFPLHDWTSSNTDADLIRDIFEIKTNKIAKEFDQKARALYHQHKATSLIIPASAFKPSTK
jgi:hypothetical protein